MIENKLTTIERDEMYQEIVEYSFETTIIHSNQKVLYINQAGADFLRADKKTVIGVNIVDVFTDEYRELIIERIRQGTEERMIGELMETSIRRFDGSLAEVEMYCHPVQFGEGRAIQTILRDVTEYKTAERELKKRANEVATPIVPVLDGVAVLPLIGSVDGDRNNQLLEIIPEKIKGLDLECLIIDVSGIYNIDEVVAEFLYKIHAILQLLGVNLIFTGIRPELAQKAVEAKIDFNSLHTLSNVKEALKELFAKQ